MATVLDRLRQRAADLYPDEELASAVVEDAQRLGTVERIVAGELNLPHPHDAQRWHDRETGRSQMTATERSQERLLSVMAERTAALEKTIADLEGRLATMSAALPPPPVNIDKGGV